MKRRLQRARRSGIRVIDVARAAQCSTATVSRVLNSPELVSAETRDRVGETIRELGYVPNSAARALRSNRSRMVGTVIPTLNYAVYANFVEAVQRRLAEGGCSLLVATFELDLDREAEQAALLVERGAEGLIFIGARHRRALHRFVASCGVPYVYTHVYREHARYPCIGMDNHRAMVEIVEYLYDLGHRRFGVISGETADNDRASTRIGGIRAALAARGIELTDDAIVERRYSIDAGREGLRILAQRKPRPTAIICGNDILAFGALMECRDLDLAVPGQISITGFDNLEFTSHLAPPLTTMEYRSGEMGEKAAAYLLESLSGKRPPSRVLIETRLIARGTTAGAPRGRASARR